MILPGIPNSSAIRVKIGDPVQVLRPDGTTIDTTVRGIEMLHGTTPDRSMIPLLLDRHLTKCDLTIDSDILIDAPVANVLRYRLASTTLQELATTLLKIDDSHHVQFGWSAVTIHCAEISDLCRVAFEFRDYIMEGFVTYLMSAIPADHDVDLTIGLMGTNRDDYVRPQVTAYLKQAGMSHTQGT